MKAFHRHVSMGCVAAAAVLLLAGHATVAGLVWLLGTVIELVGAAATGKQGNDTER
jgi:hypothetical protein